jgi:hypothetical protein
VHVFSLDAMRHHYTLPRSTSRATSIAFSPTAGARLVVTESGPQVFRVHDVEARRVAPLLVAGAGASVPRQLVAAGPVVGCTFDAARPDVLILYGRDFACIHDPHADTVKAGFRIIRDYKHILAVLGMGRGEVAVVETPWMHVLRDLPQALERHRYGG